MSLISFHPDESWRTFIRRIVFEMKILDFCPKPSEFLRAEFFQRCHCYCYFIGVQTDQSLKLSVWIFPTRSQSTTFHLFKSCEKIICCMFDQTRCQSFFLTRLRGFQSIFSRKCGKTAETRSPGLHVAALVVSLNLSLPSKTTKIWTYYDVTSWRFAEVLTVLIWMPLSKWFLFISP